MKRRPLPGAPLRETIRPRRSPSLRPGQALRHPAPPPGRPDKFLRHGVRHRCAEDHVELKALATEINREHQAAHTAARNAIEHAVECGRLLIEAKRQVRTESGCRGSLMFEGGDQGRPSWPGERVGVWHLMVQERDPNRSPGGRSRPTARPQRSPNPQHQRTVAAQAPSLEPPSGRDAAE